jgi:hypothetical protein
VVLVGTVVVVTELVAPLTTPVTAEVVPVTVEVVPDPEMVDAVGLDVDAGWLAVVVQGRTVVEFRLRLPQVLNVARPPLPLELGTTTTPEVPAEATGVLTMLV